jgi:hypothetical protein
MASEIDVREGGTVTLTEMDVDVTVSPNSYGA